MQVKVLASGSRGNCTLVKTETTNILIDEGILYTRLASLLEEENLDPRNDLAAVILTHSHNDHTKGLPVFCKKTSCSIYVPKGMEEQLVDIVPLARIKIFTEPFLLGEIEVTPIPTSHDVFPSVGYLLENKEKSLLYMTDTGYINERLFTKIKDKSMYILESNHDVKMLMDGPYPRYLKERVNSDKGHLSNAQAARYLSLIAGKHTKNIILAHLSEKNNTDQLAYDTVSSRLRGTEDLELKIVLAHQDEATELIEV